jgi:hypothetical protein
MARTLPPLMQVMKDVGGVEVPEYFARLTPDAEPMNGAAAGSAPTTPKG